MRAAGERLRPPAALAEPFRRLPALVQPLRRDMVHIADRFAAGEPRRAPSRYRAFQRHWRDISAEIERILSRY